MAQNLYPTINPATKDGKGLAADLNGLRDVLGSQASGASRPTWARAGMLWYRTPATGSPQIMLYDGTRDIPVLAISGGRAALDPGLSVIPARSIIMWSGGANNVPAGWGLCDGQDYPSAADPAVKIASPDLRGRFVISVGDGRNTGAIGGRAEDGKVRTEDGGAHGHSMSSAGGHDHGGATRSHALTLAQIPAHRHAITPSGRNKFPGPDVTYDYSSETKADTTRDERSGIAGGGEAHAHGISDDGDHRHTISTGGTHDHLVTPGFPLFYALAYIIKL